MNIEEKLNALAELQAQAEVLRMDYEKLRNEVIPEEVRAKLAEIDAKFKPLLDGVSEKSALLEAEIKADVIQAGSTVKASHFMAVYNKGRVSWDGKQLEGMMAIIPGLASARKEGEPSVTLRRVS